MQDSLCLPMTDPSFKSCPVMTAASSSKVASDVRTVPWPALKFGLSSSAHTAASTASRLVPPSARTRPSASAAYSAFFGVLSALIIPYLRRSTFVHWHRHIAGARLGVEGAATVAAACAAAGIIVGIVQISGLGFKFSALVVGFSGGSLDVALLLAMIAAFIFGMGMPTTAAYIVQATLVAPALIELGADPLGAHLFVFYYAVLGQITPPLAVAAYAAAPIAGEKANRVGWSAFLIGLPIYIIPFMFVSNAVLLTPEFSVDLIYSLCRSVIAVAALSAVAIGWIFGAPLRWPARSMLVLSAVLMIHPDISSSVMGAMLLAAIYLFQNHKSRRLHGIST